MMRSNASIFERRGDPWTANGDYEEIRILFEKLTPQHRRLVEINNRLSCALVKAGIPQKPVAPTKRCRTEVVLGDPEMDQFTKATKAPERTEMKSEPRKFTTATPRRKIVNILAKMHKDMREASLADSAGGPVPVLVPEGRPVVEPPKLVKQAKKGSTGFFVYHLLEDGTEEEKEWSTPKVADLAFTRWTRKPEVVRVELWSNSTGDCEKVWTRNPNK